MAFLLKAAESAVKNLRQGFVPESLTFDGLRVMTTGLLAEGGYSFVYSAREVASNPRIFAAKKMLAQDDEARACAEIELRLLREAHAARLGQRQELARGNERRGGDVRRRLGPRRAVQQRRLGEDQPRDGQAADGAHELREQPDPVGHQAALERQQVEARVCVQHRADLIVLSEVVFCWSKLLL